MARWWLRRNIRVAVEYGDSNRFGSPISDRCERSTEQLFAPVSRYAQGHTFAQLTASASQLLAEVVASPAFDEIAESDGAGAWRLRPDVLYPDPAKARPRTLVFSDDETGRILRVNLPVAYWPWVHGLVADLAGQGCDDQRPIHPDLAALLQRLVTDGLVQRESGCEDGGIAVKRPALTYVGHNTVVVRSESAAVIVDPLLFPDASSYPDGYQPLQVRDLGELDAILITHSHPDHFATASLLQFPPDTRVIVPRVERETLLAVAMARRLRELGFTRISELDWWESTNIGDIEVQALPFYGEQPTDGEVLHPEVRNAGNTYIVRTPRHGVAFLADSGRDGTGDVRSLASCALKRFGPIDAVFSGYRGWFTYPIQLLFSSVARYLLFVPPFLWNVRQQLMTDAHSAIDVAERWGARLLVPYADGGAPWYWQAGLGARLDEMPVETASFDPFPERVLEAARTRSDAPDGASIPSVVRPWLLRPGDSISAMAAQTEKPLRVAGHAWPYDEPAQSC